MGAADVSGNDNTALGQAALGSLTSGECNVALGANALGAATTGCDNVAIGQFKNIKIIDAN